MPPSKSAKEILFTDEAPQSLLQNDLQKNQER